MQLPEAYQDIDQFLCLFGSETATSGFEGWDCMSERRQKEKQDGVEENHFGLSKVMTSEFGNLLYAFQFVEERGKPNLYRTVAERIALAAPFQLSCYNESQETSRNSPPLSLVSDVLSRRKNENHWPLRNQTVCDHGVPRSNTMGLGVSSFTRPESNTIRTPKRTTDLGWWRKGRKLEFRLWNPSFNSYSPRSLAWQGVRNRLGLEAPRSLPKRC